MAKINRKDLQIRDPFVVAEDGIYYLFGSTDKDIWNSRGVGFDVYTSADLETFEGPFNAFRPAADFWSDTNFWAPEAHRFRGEWYLFATFLPKPGAFPGYTSAIPRKDGGSYGVRGTAILKSSGGAAGPYFPHSDGPVTPRDWECLDGTLHVDESGKPCLVFCHEWQQVRDGEMCVLELAEDLRSALGRPRGLFRASEAPWAAPLKNRAPGSYVTDGPFLWRDENGGLLMLWSSFNAEGNYCLGLARSEGGNLRGPWRQSPRPLFSSDGGHGMLFRGLDGEIRLALHSPNKTPQERAVFIKIKKEDLCKNEI